jgi:hypothetical protein
LPITTFDAERFATTVAPANVAKDDGGVGTHRSSQISTCRTKPGCSGTRKSRAGAERGRLSGELDLGACSGVARREVARLVELAIVRQIGLRHHAHHPAAAEQRGAVVQQAVHRHRQPDQRGDREPSRALDQPREGALGLVDQRALVEKGRRRCRR